MLPPPPQPDTIVHLVTATDVAPCWPPYHRAPVYASLSRDCAERVAAAYRRVDRDAAVRSVALASLPFLPRGIDFPAVEALERAPLDVDGWPCAAAGRGLAARRGR